MKFNFENFELRNIETCSLAHFLTLCKKKPAPLKKKLKKIITSQKLDHLCWWGGGGSRSDTQFEPPPLRSAASSFISVRLRHEAYFVKGKFGYGVTFSWEQIARGIWNFFQIKNFFSSILTREHFAEAFYKISPVIDR